MNSISLETALYEMVFAEWPTVHSKNYKKISKQEELQLKSLKKKRQVIIEKIKAERENSRKTALKTDCSWNIFLEYINDLSNKEALTIREINAARSSKEKLRSIFEYESVIREIENGHYRLRNKEIELSGIFGDVIDRFNNAGCFCAVCDSDNNTFRLHPLIVMIGMNPRTYNHVFISFHSFRLKPNKESARNFFLQALSAIERNLEIPDDNKNISIDVIITQFCEDVTGFVRQNKEVIEQLDFRKIQEDSAGYGQFSKAVTEDELYHAEMENLITAASDEDLYDRQIETILSGKSTEHSFEEVNAVIEKLNNRFAIAEQMASARQIVISLNLIYVFCEAIRIALTNKHANIKIKNPAVIEKSRIELLKVEDWLVHKVYANIDERTIGMLEYREKYGIDTRGLSEREAEEDKYINGQFSDILKNSISELAKNINATSIDELLILKKKIRKRIMEFPECDEKDIYSSWLDSISDDISDALIRKCKAEQDDYSNARTLLISNIGAGYEKLPESAIDSLTTAELLYKKYAVDKYAQSGFDYSSISALYYQAFEAAYNSLIWSGYANYLNSLIIDDKSFTEHMQEYKGHFINGANNPVRGYLDSRPKQRAYYLNYPNDPNQNTTVTSRCMFRSFAILMKDICYNSPLDKLCNYFASISGYENSAEMLGDASFMQKCNSFAQAVDQATENRNNASHGGSYITKDQCGNDKRTVLNNILNDRSLNLGLVLQLIRLVK